MDIKLTIFILERKIIERQQKALSRKLRAKSQDQVRQDETVELELHNLHMAILEDLRFADVKTQLPTEIYADAGLDEDEAKALLCLRDAIRCPADEGDCEIMGVNTKGALSLLKKGYVDEIASSGKRFIMINEKGLALQAKAY